MKLQFSPINQAWFLLWRDQVLKIYPNKIDAVTEARRWLTETLEKLQLYQLQCRPGSSEWNEWQRQIDEAMADLKALPRLK